MICPMMSRPSERGFERVECPQDGDCGWWTGEQCAVTAIAKNTKPNESESRNVLIEK